ncbi:MULTISPECIES: hypothetical protein [Vibrio]|uniref:hypothetical protein n=1 Tax=Vibrio TaxID=662 RepID=UPI003D0BF271
MNIFHIQVVIITFVLALLVGCNGSGGDSKTNTQNQTIPTSQLTLPEQLEVVTNENE